MTHMNSKLLIKGAIFLTFTGILLIVSDSPKAFLEKSVHFASTSKSAMDIAKIFEKTSPVLVDAV